MSIFVTNVDMMKNQTELNGANLYGVAEIAIRYKSIVPAQSRAKVTNPKEATDVLRYAYNRDEADLDYVEAFYVIYLNRRNRVLAIEQIGKGGISGTVADPKVIFQRALLLNSSQIILAHNHPSGNLKPSAGDLRLTKQIVQAGKFLDIPVLDHFIMTGESSYSFTDDNLI